MYYLQFKNFQRAPLDICVWVTKPASLEVGLCGKILPDWSLYGVTAAVLATLNQLLNGCSEEQAGMGITLQEEKKEPLYGELSSQQAENVSEELMASSNNLKQLGWAREATEDHASLNLLLSSL